MKNFFLIASVLVFSFTSCDIESLEEDLEDSVENSIEINQTVEEEFSIPQITEIGEQEPVEVSIDTQEILDALSETDQATLESVSLEDAQIVIPEGIDATFDFLESLSIVITSGDFAGTELASITEIPEGATELSLTVTEGAPNLVELIESGDFEIEINYTVDELLAEGLDLEIISDFLVDLGINF